MKLKLSVFVFFLSLVSTNVMADNVGLRFITNNGKVRCGADVMNKAFAERDENGRWSGFAADWCRVFAGAMLNNSEAFEMVDVSDENMSKAFQMDAVDVVIGAHEQNASIDVVSSAGVSALVMYDDQVILAKKKDGAEKLGDYAGEKMCAVMNSADIFYAERYLKENNVSIYILPARGKQQMKENILLNRCTMITGKRVDIMAFHKHHLDSKDTYEILKEVVVSRPLYVYAKKDNMELQKIVKWVVNALKLAEDSGLSSKSLETFIGVDDSVMKNLLGIDGGLWSALKLPDAKWVGEVIKTVGNYGEIYESNFGDTSDFKLERGLNKLLKDGGVIGVEPFL